ncbi:unnamed protein product [Urochloa decumbens]|uniref:RRM domain-containing protein n=1 Tax=Urochloa decumbens TaxID=240449 RepID=A0ABC9D9P2_9POAL
MAPYAVSARLSLPRLLEVSAATAPGGDSTRSGAASAMAPYAASARLPLPRLLETAAATAAGLDPTRAGAASRERGLRVAVAYGVSLLRGLPAVHLDRKHMQEEVPRVGNQAMTEMNGPSCSSRPKRIGPVPSKADFDNNTQGTDSYHDPNNSRLFVGCLDQSITDDDPLQAFSPYGELVNVKVLASKAWGFVTYSNRASAEEAMIMLNGSQLGSNTMRLWGYCSASKQYQLDRQNEAYTSTLHNDDPNVAALMGAGLVLRRGFLGNCCDKRSLSRMMGYGSITRLFFYALAFNGFSQACKDGYSLCCILAYAARRYSPDSWRPFGECMVQHYREEMSSDFGGGCEFYLLGSD